MDQAYNSRAWYLRDKVDFNPTWPDGSESIQHHMILTYHGSRLSHAWLSTERFGEQASTHDGAGKGQFALFTDMGGAEPWQAVAEAAMKALRGNVDIIVRSNGHGQEFSDKCYLWDDHRGVDEGGAVLARPDKTVAWRCKNALKVDAGVKLTHGLRSISWFD